MAQRSLVGLALVLALAAPAPEAGRDPAIGRTYQVPYRLTDTNHALVRVRIDGKGPFNFLVDTGAPALFVGTAAARKAGLEPDPAEYFTRVRRLDFEGGPSLTGIQARVEDPFQLVGMNALGLPGASIDGILGFNVLARFRVVLDPTQDRMTWTRLDFEPKDLEFAPPPPGQGPPPEVQMMGVMGLVAKMMATMVGRQPEEQLHPGGCLGLELADADGEVRVAGVLADSPAAAAEILPGDRLLRVLGRDVRDVAAALRAAEAIRPGDRVQLTVRRDAQTRELTVVAGEEF
jgi:PDZ domain/Aspartyl protease